MKRRRVTWWVIPLVMIACAKGENEPPFGASDASTEGVVPPIDGSTDAGTGGAGGAMVCVPGKQESCACPGGLPGAQTCNQTGSGYDPCVCPDGGIGGAGGSAGTGGFPSTGGVPGTGGIPGTGGAPATGGQPSGGSPGTGGTAATGGAAGAIGNPDTCPGATITFVGPTASVSNDTRNYSADHTGPCFSSASYDVVYHVVAPWSGSVRATVTPSGFAATIYWAEGSCTGTVGGCTSGVNVGVPASLTIPAVANEDYYIYVDGWTVGFGGPFTLVLQYI